MRHSDRFSDPDEGANFEPGMPDSTRTRHPGRGPAFLPVRRCQRTPGNSSRTLLAGTRGTRSGSRPIRHITPIEAGSEAGPSVVPDSAVLMADLLSAAHAHFQASRLDTAEAFLRLVPGPTTDPWRTWRDLGHLHFSLAEFEAAGRAYGYAAAFRPDMADLQVDLARTCLELDDIDNFEAYLTRALRLEPDNRCGLKLLADLHRNTGGYSDAAGIYERLAKAEPGCPEHLLSLALCRALEGSSDKALAVLQQMSPAATRAARGSSREP